ncbi:TP901-1 family phage major tail protein [Rhodothalassium salexigens DSM 2132]|uniref:TP901-1 family phage major tail protein n=1 Tax=Rhodothalassium salexigens DSM 2132 TaxID=1188247 RepID=A0A4R2PQH1_RHOSA|nr:phage major tail protein, TP901-1 family [Rhodothalassium salexigens]MBB4210997.1 TP901-1 family phage major tail protein [Rhodothalassium salexigens DSM 2132]MBK1638728.1 phage major tail protein, TP901-1 family [Rhodothalassium salexigens DSM 2132]TCP36345.1 TP901-1 family phage major tail protein [Rhodothalassium salexigens DSM 2132]
MTAESGAGFLLKAGDGSSPENYTTLAGLRSTSMTVNAGSVDITHKGSGGWRELLGRAGVRSLSVSAAGVFMDASAETRVRQNALDGRLASYQLVFANGDSFEGRFLVTALAYAGDHDGERSYTVQLESSGPVAFSAGTTP